MIKNKSNVISNIQQEFYQNNKPSKSFNLKQIFIKTILAILIIGTIVCQYYIILEKNNKIQNLTSKIKKEYLTISPKNNLVKRNLSSKNHGNKVESQKSRVETGLDYVMFNLELSTPFGKKQLKELIPFFPGEEEELRKEFGRTEKMIKFVNQYKYIAEKLQQIFMCMKEMTLVIDRSRSVILSMVDIYEIKSLLLSMRKIKQLTEHPEEVAEIIEGTPENELVKTVPEEYFLENTEDLLDELDPRKERMDNFYIYDEFSPILGEFRNKKKIKEKAIRKEQKVIRDKIKKEYGILLSPKFDIVVARSHDDFNKIKNIPELEEIYQDYMSVTFKIKANDKVNALIIEMEKLNLDIEVEEEKIRGILSRKIAKKANVLLKNSNLIGKLDLALAKALYSIKHNLVKPLIVEEHVIEFENGRNLQVEDIIKEKGKEFCPISLELKDGVTVITGANMGGKTITLKLAGQISIMAQYGFFVPAKTAKIGLSNYIQILIGDSQSMERGLSTFGSEMEELKEILENSKERSLILVDEIASGTNPTEGTAMTKSLVDYLIEKPYISLITTHFDSVGEREGVINMQVRGLSGCDFDTLHRQIKMAKSRHERIDLISRYMDYRLFRVENGAQVPRDALNIASMLGIDKAIIEGAKKYINKN